MCAIAGVLDLPLKENVARKMLMSMAHRGPDGNGIFQKENCALLHSRLSVIDPVGGAQPMTAQFGQNTYTIVYNGELYNAYEIKKELESLGHCFVTRCDTEVLLHAYIQWQEECLEHLNGIFAFAVWDHRAKRLFLARDRMGVKPLFYALHQGGLVFSSEMKTILQYPTVKAQLDECGVAEILMLGPGRTPGSGILYGIFEIEPGCCGYYENGRLQIKRYWKLQDREHTATFEETAEQVRYLVTDAIKRQMVSDVPIGTFLSGGLDSSLITALCAQEKKKQGEQLDTFSVDYADNDKYFVPDKFQPNSDGHYIRLMQNQFDTKHHWCILTPEDLMDELENATYARDLPGMADVDFSLLAFCREIRKSVTVALSGECADEIFGGYPWYRDSEIRDADGFPWAQNVSHRCSLLPNGVKATLDGVDFVYSRYRNTCDACDILPGTDPLNYRMKQMMNLNIRWFMQTLLDRKDRMSMYSALEVRVPFCDHRIAEYLYGVPWEFKDYKGKEKGLLRYAMKDILPEEVLWRKKSPYPKTFDPRYMELVTERLRQIPGNSPLYQILNKNSLRQILEGESSWPWYGQLMRKPQMIAYFLQVERWLRKYNIDIFV